MDTVRVLALVACAGLVSWGLGLGAVLQHEEHLPPDAESARESAGAASGDPVVLTAVLVALGGTGALMVLSRQKLRRRIPELAVAAFAFYLLTNLVQTGWPQLLDFRAQGDRAAHLSINLFLFNGNGLGSVFVPIYGSAIACLLGARWAVRRLLARPTAPATAVALLRRHIGWHALSLPLSAVGAIGTLRLVGEVPDDQVFARLLLPILAIAILAVEGVGLVKLWHLGRAARDGRWAPVAAEALQGLSPIEQALVPLILGLAALGLLMPRLELGTLQPGYTFGVNLQNHVVFLSAAVIPHLPRLWEGNPAEALRRTPVATVSGYQHIAVWLSYGAGLACIAGAAIAVWLLPGALWPWAIAWTAAVALGLLGGRSAAAPVLAMAALTWWALGNNLEASFDAALGGNLGHPVSSGWLAFLRLIGLLLAGLAAAAVARALGPDERPSLAIPLSVAVALGVMGAGLMELTLDISVVNRFAGVSVAQGSLLAAQDEAVQGTMHGLCFFVVATAFVALARLARPDWFVRRPTRPQRTPAGAPTAS